MRYLCGVPPWPMLVMCPCGQWHRAPIRATEEFRLRLECDLLIHLTFEEPGPFIQFIYKGSVVEIVDLGTGVDHLYVKLEER